MLGRAVDALGEADAEAEAETDAGRDADDAASWELEQPAVISAAAITRMRLRGAVMGGE